MLVNQSIDLFTDGLGKAIRAGKDFSAKIGANTVLSALVGADANQLLDLLKMANTQPSIAYVPIQAESLEMRKQNDVSNTMLISQISQQKDYVTDNVAPRPRTWTISGYLTSLNPLTENGMLIKPSIRLQQQMLDAASDSRSTVKFKTDDGEVFDVVITELRIGSVPKGVNAKTITVSVQEVKVLTNSENLIPGVDLGDAAANSVVGKAAINLGKNMGRTLIKNNVSRLLKWSV